jgi:hypothetical protein
MKYLKRKASLPQSQDKILPSVKIIHAFYDGKYLALGPWQML